MLYQEMRPKSLKGIVGNEAVVGALESIIKKPSGDRPHAFLFSGGSGCGKTTFARILATGFGCKEGHGIHEYNAANSRGIDTIRALSETLNYYPMFGGVKVIILDEVHQLTSEAQSALLKVLEETPDFVYFMLCTTEPEKVIATVRNRCTQFKVSLLSDKKIKALLDAVCSEKKWDVLADTKENITYFAEGCPREALKLLEMLHGLDEDAALQLLVKNTEKDNVIFELCRLLNTSAEARVNKWKHIVEVAMSLEDDTEKARKSILKYLGNRVLECKNTDEAKDLARTLTILSVSTFYGGKPQFIAQIIRICIGGENV